jgi:hypothetical protein
MNLAFLSFHIKLWQTRNCRCEKFPQQLRASVKKSRMLAQNKSQLNDIGAPRKLKLAEYLQIANPFHLARAVSVGCKIQLEHTNTFKHSQNAANLNVSEVFSRASEASAQPRRGVVL